MIICSFLKTGATRVEYALIREENVEIAPSTQAIETVVSLLSLRLIHNVSA